MLAHIRVFPSKWAISCTSPIGKELTNVILRELVNKDAGKESFKSRLWINYCTFILGGTPVARTRFPISQTEELQRNRQEKLDLSTAEIGLTVRTTNCLEEKGIFTVRDLLKTTRNDLLSISNFGEKTLEEVYYALENIGFYRSGTENGNR
jgi:DNA-directed RNA polymerase subunit alpha